VSPAEAIATVSACLERGDVTVREHVYLRLRERNLQLVDLFDLLGDADGAWSDGHDRHGRERWFLSGTLYDGTRAETLVVIDVRPHATVFTIYWL
jgi:hypothetical protein